MFEFKFSDIGEGVHEGEILKWEVEVGDEVKEGDTLCVVETDKVNAELPSPVSGKVAQILYKVGDTIHVGNTIIVIDDGSGTAVTPDVTTAQVSEEEEESAGVVGEIEVSSEVIASSSEASKPASAPSTKKVLATPVARALAKDLGVDIQQVKGTGPAGRVMKEDIYQAKEETAPTRPAIEVPALKTTGEVERIKLTKMRKTIAKNMVASKTIIPHTATMMDYDVTKLVNFRREHKPLAEAKAIKLTYMPFIVKAVTIALKEFPIVNASLDEANDEIVLKKYYNIGIAVDTEEGLMVPVVKNADQLSIFDIAKEIEATAEAARTRSIGLDKLTGGTFTITNYGTVGANYGVPVINHPESAIIGIGMIEKKPVVVDNEIVIRDIMPVSISFDHRIIDGGDAGRFLLRVKELLTDPVLLLLN